MRFAGNPKLQRPRDGHCLLLVRSVIVSCPSVRGSLGLVTLSGPEVERTERDPFHRNVDLDRRRRTRGRR